MSETTMRVPAEWTNDCQGKKDFDGELVSISSRYWPRGGGFSVLMPGSREFVPSSAISNAPPSAKSSIIIRSGTGDDAESFTLESQEFEAETEDEVKRQVEVWAAEQYARVVAALQREFGESPE